MILKALAVIRFLQRFDGVRHISMCPVGSRNAAAPRRINVSINAPVTALENFRDPDIWRRHITELLPPIAPLLRQTIDTPN